MTKDEMIKESKRLTVALEELAEEIDNAEDFTPFDVRRTSLDLRTAARLTTGVTEKLKQVGTWTQTSKK